MIQEPNGLGAEVVVEGTEFSASVMAASFPPGVAVLGDNELRLYRWPNLVASDDDWGDAANAGEVAASPSSLRPRDGREAALLLTLEPGLYSAQLRGMGGQTSVGLIGVDDLTGR